MTIYERLKFLANKQGKSINRVEEDLKLPKNSLYSLKKAAPSSERLELLADYFHVSVDYLLGRDELKTITDVVDLKKVISEKKPTSWDDPRINWNEWVSFDGEPISDDVKKMLFAIYGDKLTD